jgi:hypothetical protein
MFTQLQSLTTNLINFLASEPNKSYLPSKQIICGGKCPLLDTSSFNIQSKEDIVRVIINLARVAAYIAVPIAVVMIIFTGVKAMVLPEQKPLQAIVTILIGLGIILLSFSLTSGFSDLLTSGIDINKLF